MNDNHKNAAFLIFIIFFCTFTVTAQMASQATSKPVLIFQSGFEGTTKVIPDKNTNDYGAYYEHIAGNDKSVRNKGNWDKDWASVLSGGFMQVQYTGGDSTKRFARIEPEPGNPKNHVLHYWLNDSWHASEGQQKARIQTNLYGIKGGFKEFYQSVRLFLTEDFNAIRTYPHQIGWCTISEFWNNEWWVKDELYGFRVTLGIGKESAESKELHFILEAENAGQKLVWRADHTKNFVAVPVGKWFTMDYYFKEGNQETGRFYLAITPEGGRKQVVYDVTNFTHMTKDPAPNGLTGYNPMKLYTSKEIVAYAKAQGKTLQVYWDDFKLWKNKRPE
jgi:hypothetical protein